MPDTITEKTKLVLPMGGWSQVVVVLAVLIGMYYSLRQDVKDAVKQGSEAATMGTRNAADIQDMKMGVQRIGDKLDFFRTQYEKDMAKYIRDTPSH